LLFSCKKLKNEEITSLQDDIKMFELDIGKINDLNNICENTKKNPE